MCHTHHPHHTHTTPNLARRALGAHLHPPGTSGKPQLTSALPSKEPQGQGSKHLTEAPGHVQLSTLSDLVCPALEVTLLSLGPLPRPGSSQVPSCPSSPFAGWQGDPCPFS